MIHTVQTVNGLLDIFLVFYIIHRFEDETTLIKPTVVAGPNDSYDCRFNDFVVR
jgi:hypothetical protein